VAEAGQLPLDPSMPRLVPGHPQNQVLDRRSYGWRIPAAATARRGTTTSKPRLSFRAANLVEFGAAGELAGRLVGEELLAAGRPEGVGLGFGMLVAGGDRATPRFSRPGAYRGRGERVT
jgi:hypothetical protein